MVNRQNGFFAKLTGLTSSVFNLNLENIHDPVDENLTPLEKAVLYGNSSKKCRKIIFVKELVKSLNSIEYEDFKKDIYPLLVKLSNDKEEIQYELCCQMGDLCAYLLQSNNGPDGCEDIIKFLFPIIERIIRNSQGASIGGSADGGDVVANAMKALLILATHIKAKYRKSIIFPFILSLLSSEKFKNLGFVLLIKISYIFEKEIVSRHLFLCIETFVREKDEESKLFLSCYLHNICKIANEEELLVIFFILKSLCNDPNDTIKIISMYNCVHLSCLFSKSHFFHFFVPLFNDFLKNTNLYVFYYALINMLFFVCLFEDLDLIHPFYIRKMIFFFNNVFSSHLFTLNYLNDTAKRQSSYALGGDPRGGVAPSPVGEAQKTEEPPKTEEQHEAEKSRGVTQADILSNKKVHVPTGINSDSSKMPHDQSSQENVEISDASDGNHEEKREVQEETPLTMNCVRVSQNVINQPINMDEPKDEAEAQQMGGGRYYSKPNNNVKEEYSDGSVEANTLENVNGGENGITTQHSGLSLFPSSSSLLESSNGTSLLPSLLPSPSTSSLITPGATSIFVNNGFINDLIIRNNHFAVSVRQFFQIHGEEAKGGGEETKEKVPVHEQEYTHKGESQSGDDITNNKSVLLGEEEKKGKDPTYEGNYNDEFYNLTDNDITCIDRIYNHDKTIDIKQIKGWYYSDVDIIKGNMAYGTIFLHKEGKMDTSTERRPRKIHLNQKEDDIYNVETVNVEAIKKKFLFDTPNNIIVSHNINAVYITALHMPTLILVLKQHFFRFFSHVFFFVCTYPYYIIRKTMASLLYQILVNFLDPPNFLEVTTDELNQEEDMMIEFMKSGKNRILNRKSNFFSYPHLHKTDFEKDRGGKNYSTREEFPQVMQTFKMDYATYCNMKRIQSMQSVTSDEKISNMDNSSSSGHEVGESTPPTSNGLTEKQQGGDNFSDYGYLQEGPHDQAANQVDEDVRTKMDKESEEGVQDKNNAIKRVQSEINANLQEGDFFKNEENENFFFYKKFLQKYESVYERYIQRFRKYYSEDSSLFFFHFFIFYFLRDSNVLVKKAILKRYDKMVLLFPRMVQKVLMSYLSHVLDCKTLDYSLRKRVSKVVFRILSCEEDAEVVRRFLFPLFLRLCKDDVAIIRTYTASYFYLFLEKGCPQIYNFFKGGGEILPIEEYKKDRILTNGEKYKLRSRYFTGGAEIALIKTVLVMFARSCRFFDRQIFIKMCDGIINECPANLFLLYFLKPFANLSVDKVQVVRTTWDKCVISQLKKKGHFLNTINIWGIQKEMHTQQGTTIVDKENSPTPNKGHSDNVIDKTFDIQDLND
ncbi:conserved Plasmodium protein, unknown function [Plasmodium knowlesi strain H]|uniref:Uncharacterized protein n=3 Tax=Plasmodium knowlesi TaxID=5850 RepID=A0A5K1TZ39_PLAKH|nr:conserved Plasmodium protein, unknown function [Plasmodium knowlesi strain H]OTN68231.1 Uncharacterized protein PKNOH_S03335000 [Plasmodium knowlesi]CAA9987247.1 conserved Plasmodium protein, unknown function [Plasmodium knowlesi strain H]SBO24019.1 conserved Plasmodium protein, unknown function [Plasmodium knowlesi strain H]SBO26025.1 conserved Plasmodium protein, unknown function [Plasmodium knowlesi strain H]VVS76721.1 conserved Plasmodium protein, unknown function [Plasmodium knowlesi s|eukprot:XP_002261869.1 hypothetical protein, conserved in Plasmodium species [Plasmodium knowlesi strain H]